MEGGGRGDGAGLRFQALCSKAERLAEHPGISAATLRRGKGTESGMFVALFTNAVQISQFCRN